MSVEKKLLDFQSKAVTVRKDTKNSFFKSNYADINAVLKAVQPILTEVGLSYTQMPDILDDGTNVLRTTIFDAEKPESNITSVSRLIMAKNDMQQYGSAQTYARRYALVAMLGLEAEDDDGNSVSGKGNAPKKTSKSANTSDEW
jgi:hypothetical protein